VKEEELDMSNGFFDTAYVSNCTLTLFNLTKITLKDGTEVEKDKWKEKILYNVTSKKLKVKDY